MKHLKLFTLILVTAVSAACGANETSQPTTQPANPPAVQETALPRPGKFILAALL